ncbi:MAG: outer membrane protein transport protein [Flavobacteriaceae bacterium]
MLRKIFKFSFLLFTTFAFAQTGHLMQGVGAVNMSMGGAATAQPLDISGAMQWNPATLSAFDGSILKFDIGMFKGTPTLYSSLPAGMLGPGAPAVSGATDSELGISPMPALAFTWGKAESKSRFGVSLFGISGFGVDFPTETNNPLSPTFNPGENSNPILYPQQAMGFGNLNSNYMFMQIGFTWAYKLSDKLSIGVQPTVNYASLTLEPNPIAQPSQTLGYPVSDATASYGIGGQLGIFYDTQNGFKIGASYKTPQYMSEMEFDSKYLDGSTAPSPKFTMDYPAIYSVGLGYSKGEFDLALDYRYVDYANTEGFEASGWQIADSGPAAGFPTGAVNGFGWNSISIVSVGVQYKGIEKLPLRLGYTYSSNPIKDELAFYSTPATAIIANAFQAGLSYEINDSFRIDGVFHYGVSNGKTEGQLLNPTPAVDFNGDGFPDGPWDATANPLGKIPGSTVAYDMKTWMLQFGVSYKFGQKNKKEEVLPE